MGLMNYWKRRGMAIEPILMILYICGVSCLVFIFYFYKSLLEFKIEVVVNGLE
jgi:hypothetical protein